jgi:mannose-6-phosphate isomerase-like protein (cupin superfamily)
MFRPSPKHVVRMMRKAMIVPPGQGRVYPAGRMQAVFKADLDETASRYSVSEWWLEPRTRLPGQHAHEEDHVFYIIEGTLSVLIEADWSHAPKGSYLVIPGGTPHTFENREAVRTGFISFNVPGGFEEKVPDIASALADTDLTI